MTLPLRPPVTLPRTIYAGESADLDTAGFFLPFASPRATRSNGVIELIIARAVAEIGITRARCTKCQVHETERLFLPVYDLRLTASPLR
jgi:hypothetical protein